MDLAVTRVVRFGVPRWLRARRLVQTLGLWWTLHTERRALARLDAALLDDLGISPECARAESARRAWDVPHARRLP